MSIKNSDTKIKAVVDIFTRCEDSNPNTLLFFFENYKLTESEGEYTDGRGAHPLVDHPVRVTYDDDGLISKVEFTPTETDSSFHFKNGIVRTIQLNWKRIQDEIANGGPAPSEFDTQTKVRDQECTITTRIHRAMDTGDHFIVHSERKAGECGRNGKKDWRYTFDTSKAKNFQELTVDIETPMKGDKVTQIASGFHFKGCEASKNREWTSDWEEIDRPIPGQKH